MTDSTKKIVLFDGVCNLCNNAVQFVIRHDKKDQFRFASLQSAIGQQLLKHSGIEPGSMNSFVMIDGRDVYTRSTAALVLFKHIGGLWNLFYALIIIPPFIRDTVYKLVAQNRYRWFGKKASCPLPTPALKKKFLD